MMLAVNLLVVCSWKLYNVNGKATGGQQTANPLYTGVISFDLERLIKRKFPSRKPWY